MCSSFSALWRELVFVTALTRSQGISVSCCPWCPALWMALNPRAGLTSTPKGRVPEPSPRPTVGLVCLRALGTLAQELTVQSHIHLLLLPSWKEGSSLWWRVTLLCMS